MLWLFYGRLNYYVNNIPIVQKIRLSPMLKTPLHALLLLMIAMLCVQGSGSLAKILFQSFPVLTVSAMRLCFGAIILAIIFRDRKSTRLNSSHSQQSRMPSSA